MQRKKSVLIMTNIDKLAALAGWCFFCVSDLRFWKVSWNSALNGDPTLT